MRPTTPSRGPKQLGLTQDFLICFSDSGTRHDAAMSRFPRSRAAVITGAGAGIGRTMAINLSGSGAHLGLLDADSVAVQQTASLCAVSSDVQTLAVDVADSEAVARSADKLAARFGHVDLVYCLAGIIHTGPIASTEPADFEHVLRVNVMGAFNTAKAFLPHLIASGNGRLVFVSSAFGLMAAPNYSAYCASKFAIRGLADSLRQEMKLAGHNVQVTCAYPGGVRTGIMRRGTYAAGVDRDAAIAAFENGIARTSPEQAAAAILKGVERGKARVLVGSDARAVSLFVRAAGGAYPDLVVRGIRAAAALKATRLGRAKE